MSNIATRPRAQNDVPSDEEIAASGTPRVERCIVDVMRQYPGHSPAALARYFEAVHQELGPLARALERENRKLREQLGLKP